MIEISELKNSLNVFFKNCINTTVVISYLETLLSDNLNLNHKTTKPNQKQEVLFILKNPVCWHFREVTTDKVQTAVVTGMLKEDGENVQVFYSNTDKLAKGCLLALFETSVQESKAVNCVLCKLLLRILIYFYSMYLIRILTILSSRLIVNALYCSEKKSVWEVKICKTMGFFGKRLIKMRYRIRSEFYWLWNSKGCF